MDPISCIILFLIFIAYVGYKTSQAGEQITEVMEKEGFLKKDDDDE